MKKCIIALLAIVCIAGFVYAGASGVSDPTISVTEFTPSGGKTFKDKVKASLDSLDTVAEATIDELDKVTDGSGNAVAANTITVTDIPSGDSGVVLVDLNATGSNTNVLLSLGATLTIGDDGDGTLVETNTSAAAEYGLAIKINGDKYFILLEKE